MITRSITRAIKTGFRNKANRVGACANHTSSPSYLTKPIRNIFPQWRTAIDSWLRHTTWQITMRAFPVLTILATLAAEAVPDSSHERKLYLNGRIFGYLPSSDVSDELMLDLDQYNIEEQIMQRKIEMAKFIYEQGGHSSSFAVMNVSIVGAVAFDSGSTVWAPNQKHQDAIEVQGILDSPIATDGNFSTYAISVAYDRSQNIEPCQVGALYLVKQAVHENCFAQQGILKIAKPGMPKESAKPFNYSYDIRLGNKNARSIHLLAKELKSINRNPAGEYYRDFQTFSDFYGQPDYADHWVMSAIAKTDTQFKSGKGNANFAALVGRPGQGEAVMKGTAFLTILMTAIGKLERSMVNCEVGCFDELCTEDSIHFLDEAVAYYTGSLLAENAAANSTGVLFYSLADNRAHNFRTSGHDLGTKSDDTAYVNIHVMNRFRDIQGLIKARNTDSCNQALVGKNEIIRLIKIPLIQSVLGYAYIRDRDDLRDEDEIEKTEVKGASYVATVLPWINNCNPKEADVIYEHLKVGSGKESVNYKAIKSAMESTYNCLGITCAEVGGIWNGNEYLPDAAPCGQGRPKKAGRTSGITIAVLLCAAIGFVYFIRYRRRKLAPREMMCQGNINAVSEIA